MRRTKSVALAPFCTVGCLLLAALALGLYQLSLSTDVFEAWASRENIDRLPQCARAIGFAACGQVALALLLGILAVRAMFDRMALETDTDSK